MPPQQPERSSRVQRKRISSNVRIGLGLIFLLMGVSGIAILRNDWTALAAHMANPLRSFIGNQGVARLETFLFTIQDQINQWEYKSGRKQAVAPWNEQENASLPAAAKTPVLPTGVEKARIEGSRPVEEKETTVAAPIETVPSATETATLSMKTPEISAVNVSTSTPTPTSTEWLPKDAIPFGTVEGEGVWLPFIEDQTGRTVAARTFFQADPERPFSYVAVVAFDLRTVRLNFVVGFDEPSEKGGPKGKGVIPPEDFRAGTLLAAFNGGFHSTHGAYGAMENGFVPLPAKDEAATVAMYLDGSVRIGEWEKDIHITNDIVAYRQNCQMIVHNGEINPSVYNNSTTDWGGTVENSIVTWRSGLGISQDGSTLYYFVGPSLSMPVLADAMLAAGAYQSMLLDINAFWVHFVAIRDEGGVLVPEPLLPKDMQYKLDRYLNPFPRDFFYITLKGQ